jgi:LAS superfamily LD-carboxypeptidase LdcB
MFNPIMQSPISMFTQNPWAMLGWQPANMMPVANNYSMFNQVNNPFSVPTTNYYDMFTNAISRNNVSGSVAEVETAKRRANTSKKSNPLNLSDAKLTEYGFDTAEKREGFKKLKPEMQRAVVELTEYALSQGMKIAYASKRCIFRTREDQEKIYNSSKKGYAAKPGKSRHETGEAVDITIVGANSHDKFDPKYQKLAQKWQSMGYTWGGNWKCSEPWHFDLRASKA